MDRKAAHGQVICLPVDKVLPALIWLFIFPRKSLNGTQQTSKEWGSLPIKETCCIKVNTIFFKFVKKKLFKTIFFILSPPLPHQNFSHLCSSFGVEGDQFYSIIFILFGCFLFPF